MMVGRREQRRRNINGTVFDDERRRDVDDGRPYTIVPPLREAFDQGLRLARVYDEYDDVLVMPGLIAARTGTNAYRALEDNDSYRPHDRQDREEVGLFELQADPLDPETVERTLEEVGRLLASEPDVPTPVAPVYGFRTHQTNHPSEDPEPVPDPPLPVPTADREPKRGETVTVVVVDTGWHRTAPWTGRLAGRLKADEEQPAAGNLGFAAGHGSHVAGIILQLAPQARVVVKKAVRPDGFVTEKRLFRVLSNLPKLRWRPDILVLPLGGPAIGLGSFSTAPAERDTQRALDPAAWAEPIMLLKALEALVRDVGELAIVASAGNDDSSEPCYPAAFTWSATRPSA